jgi:hypothetical protein
LLIKRRKIATFESLGEQYTLGRRLRMKLVTYPSLFDCIFFFQLVDKALADITEGSNVIGKDFEVDHHFIPLIPRL